MMNAHDTYMTVIDTVQRPPRHPLCRAIHHAPLINSLLCYLHVGMTDKENKPQHK